MANKGYRSYRGRRRGGKSMVLPILVLILALACGFLYAQKFITYSDDGSIRFDLPFGQSQMPQGAEETTAAESPSVDVVVEKEQENRSEEPSDHRQLPDSADREYRLKGFYTLPVDMDAELASCGANGFVFTLRDHTGRVFYDSVAALRSAVTDPVSSAALRELCAREDVISVAKLNTFHDSYYAWTNMESAGICQSTGHIWYDNLSYHWLEPEKEKARDYVISLAVECAEMGFDQILLEDLRYPADGTLGKIDYTGNSMEKSDALALFLTELRIALAPYGTEIAILLDERAVGGNVDYVENSGQDLARLLPLVDAVYVDTQDLSAARASLAAAAGEGELTALIPVISEGAESGSWYLP